MEEERVRGWQQPLYIRHTSSEFVVSICCEFFSDDLTLESDAVPSNRVDSQPFIIYSSLSNLARGSVPVNILDCKRILVENLPFNRQYLDRRTSTIEESQLRLNGQQIKRNVFNQERVCIYSYSEIFWSRVKRTNILQALIKTLNVSSFRIVAATTIFIVGYRVNIF